MHTPKPCYRVTYKLANGQEVTVYCDHVPGWGVTLIQDGTDMYGRMIAIERAIALAEGKEN